ncbi:hypothetical protein sphantq_04615 (plasmid) [Sphingobium sp. AntQ-1]|uniref:hypothetical protein n=1 Tax=Sphingobium sp. AntQ-1 TaxID=2930091 RepID=UPI00234F7C5F|nr:hypothetical protein [Sphingobium sp. AntQ-1]WCP16119.1 hypothetical protein sphantq_04615 [Sphingobium sp. AntQ-1]
MTNRLCSFPVCVAQNAALIASVSARTADIAIVVGHGMTALLPYVPDTEGCGR